MSDVPDVVFRSLVEASEDFIGTIDREGRLLYLNPAGRRMLEIPADEDLVGHSIVPYNARPSAELAARASEILESNEIAGLNTFVTRSGRRIPVSQSFIAHETPLGTRYSTIARDISDRLAIEAAFREQADHDPLTGLLNRAAIRRLVAHRPRTATTTIAIADLDGFKAVNDGLGHHVGDAVLVEVAEALGAVFPEALIGRFGGDEFVVITDEGSVAAAIEEALSPLLAPVGAGVSVGVAPLPDGADLDEALRLADVRLYERKRSIARRPAALAPPRPSPPLFAAATSV